ncbi:hypothetical protein HGI30_07875 [Paenibacillus albicereus]|uniref:ABM domain-containing protein n=1 Tax=Paenibacillus albicereus TaxID=2726185 RepID=A0A6H2GVM1_9BACL|nr:hypothetical protein HGI30_07875 [Paenibacillus albicereus]
MSEQALNPELVRAFVGSAHSDLERVQQLLQEEPGLLHAAMNWGGGDWETAAGAAAHVGRKDILNWLLEQGARLDLFGAAMLGELELVRSVIERHPSQLHAKGPHGITLLQHALMGGPDAQQVVAYLKEKLGEAKEEQAGPVLVENRIVVKAGFAEAVLERFAKPKQVHTFEGFVRMDVLHGKSENEGEEEIRVCTTWRSKADFEAWASSDSFRGAHAKRQEQQAEGAAADQAERPAHGHGGHGQPAHGSGHGRPAAAGEGAGPIVGNRVTFYRVAASHLPAAAAAEQG